MNLFNEFQIDCAKLEDVSELIKNLVMGKNVGKNNN